MHLPFLFYDTSPIYNIGCNNYIICGNGAITYDIQNEEIIYNRFLEKNKVLQIIRICEENSIFYNVYTKEVMLWIEY